MYLVREIESWNHGRADHVTFIGFGTDPM